MLSITTLGLTFLTGLLPVWSQVIGNLTAPGGIVGDYSGALRPQVHFSPPKGFMNDPNGLFRDGDGVWHMYYQYNPNDTIAGNQHWGHTTSPDLYHWTNQPIALSPLNSTATIFSGSIVTDPNNTSSFFPNSTNGVVAIYTLNTPYFQVQNLAYSFDNGYTFTQYANNPVLDVGSNQFRDPKVFWHEDHWVMIIAFSVDFTIGIYTSPNLQNWTFASNLTHVGLLGLQYECPNLVSVPYLGSTSGEKAWVLVISINPGAPQGGSISQYIIGDFDGYTFAPYDSAARTEDFGKDNYAGQFFYNSGEEEAVSIAWASNWQYTNIVPTGELEGWRSVMTLPRMNYLTNLTRTGWDLVSKVYGIDSVKGDQLSYDADFGNGSVTIDFSNYTGAIYLNMTFDFESVTPVFTPSSIMNFTFTSPTTNESLKGGYEFGGYNPYLFYLDRGGTNGFDSPTFTDKVSVAQVEPMRQLEVVVDRSVVEVFIDGGEESGTLVFYTDEPLGRLQVGTGGLPGGTVVELGVWELRSVWQGR